MEFFKNKKNNILIIAVLFFLIFTASFVFIEKNFKETEEVKKKEVEKEEQEERKTLERKKIEENFNEKDNIELICEKFKEENTDRKCKEAVDKVLKEYPGKAKEVKLKNIKIFKKNETTSSSPISREEEEEKEKEVLTWIVEIELKDPLKIEDDFISYVGIALEDKGERIILYKLYKKNEN